MKTRVSLTLDADVEETLRLQATVLDVPFSRYVNKLLREKLNVQSDQIEAALIRLERKRQVED